MNHRTRCSSIGAEHRAAAPVEAGGRGDGGRLLAEVMSLNAIFSALSGLALATGAPPLAGWLGIPVWLVSSLGLGLLGFAAVLVWLLATPHRLRTGTWFVVAADLAWIVGAVVLIGLVPRALPPSGDVALTGATLVVAALAAGQLGGVARTGAGSVSGTFPLDVAAERLVPADVDRVWNAVAAAGWAETCTEWEDRRGYRMTVDVATCPWHYRALLHEFSQAWEVEAAGGHTRVTLRLAGEVKLGLLGRLVVAALSRRRPAERILAAYERDLLATGQPH